MTPDEARLHLDATTLRPQDAAPEVRAALESDEALAAWQKRQLEFDVKASDALAAMPVPGDLRARLLQIPAPNGELQTPQRSNLRSLDLALTLMAAVAAIAVAVVLLWGRSDSAMPDWQNQTLAAVKKIDSGAMPLDHFSGDLQEMKAMLVKNSRPSPLSLPRGVEALASLGCKTFQVSGRDITVVCFRISEEAEAHLAVVNNNGLQGAPPQHHPQFAHRDGWNIASWSDGQQSYFIATRAPEVMLKKLFAMMVLGWGG